ncbi:4'-phosphopantetheinyl transferase superfamily protein [Massilia sp. CF038]|uniref:4'-phosphopantetheinyl transferase family protein n=1 Tax=Massilia sp. CF038 TaxID=1881045 RepID=UPI000921AE7F|nr:4'-phosphopantetheinyl transferase superfamily protein [Massilia sp. CF038]SHG68555.1 4'-phosphopantetheinyl transferase [Massilia sp. CF038]
MALAPQVWLVDGAPLDDARLAGFTHWLSAGEQARYRAFVRQARRRQFLIGRVLLRQMLGQMLNLAPERVVLQERPGAAPQLDHPDAAAIGLSIAHSGPWVACTASLECKLGLDIEVLDPARDIGALAAQAFDAQACAWLAARPEASRLRDFYAMWCAQEARIKLGPSPAQHVVALDTAALAIAVCSSSALAQVPALLPRCLFDQSTPKSK